MKIDKLSRLLEAFGQANQNSPVRGVSNEKEVERTAKENAAVSVASDFGSKSTQASGKSREEKIAELKEMVHSGSYNPNLTAVATAVAKELL